MMNKVCNPNPKSLCNLNPIQYIIYICIYVVELYSSTQVPEELEDDCVDSIYMVKAERSSNGDLIYYGRTMNSRTDEVLTTDDLSYEQLLLFN